MTSAPFDHRKGYRRLPTASGWNGARCDQRRRTTNRRRGRRYPRRIGQLHDPDRPSLEIGLLRDGVPFRQGQLVSGMSRSIRTAAIAVIEVAVVERGEDDTLPN